MEQGHSERMQLSSVFSNISSLCILPHSLQELSSVQHGHSPLFEATLKGNKDMVDRLVDAGADPNVATTKVRPFWLQNRVPHNLCACGR